MHHESCKGKKKKTLQKETIILSSSLKTIAVINMQIKMQQKQKQHDHMCSINVQATV